jgi:hypothetical protein
VRFEVRAAVAFLGGARGIERNSRAFADGLWRRRKVFGKETAKGTVYIEEETEQNSYRLLQLRDGSADGLQVGSTFYWFGPASWASVC